ncbi:MAG: hypothetical protein FWC79_01415 [Oscillospiraceae bacterium]|nr:hypothetical protein [Oscillospiraceae bacterium]
MDNTKGKIALPEHLAKIVRKELASVATKEQRSGLGGLFFSHEEIGLITTLKIKNPERNHLIGISKLYNLQRLDISSSIIGEYIKDSQVRTITDEEIKEISEITSLKELSLIKQKDITYMPLDKLTNLEYLEIIDNNNLDTITGLDKLDNLGSVTCWGNRSLMRDRRIERSHKKI